MQSLIAVGACTWCGKIAAGGMLGKGNLDSIHSDGHYLFVLSRLAVFGCLACADMGNVEVYDSAGINCWSKTAAPLFSSGGLSCWKETWLYVVFLTQTGFADALYCTVRIYQ